MSRLLQTTRRIALIAALAALALPAAALAKPSPNIVVILTDDQTLADYNRASMPRTQRLLGGRGTTFGQAIATTPLCCPSRASLITGQYGHNNGVLRNNYADLREKANTLPVWLDRAGYTTIHVGKYMNRYADAVGSPAEIAPGWDQWHTVVAPSYYDYDLQVNGETTSFGSAPDDYLGRVIEDRSTKMVERFAPRRRPFFLQVDHYAPHIALDAEERGAGTRCAGGATPDPADEGSFAGEPLPQSPSFNEGDVSDKPSFVRSLPPLDSGQVATLPVLHQCALESLASVDRDVAAIRKSVKAAGELDRTVFVFLSDNGLFYGEHRIPGSKHNPYEEALRIPMVISAPRDLLGRRPPVRVDLPVANIDIPPTIIELAGADPCPGDRPRSCRVLDGRSLVPLLRGRERAWPEDRALVVELSRRHSPTAGDGRACDYTGVRTTAGLLAHHRGAIDPAAGGDCVPIDEFELYDLAADPFQLQSLHSTGTGAAPSALETDLSARLARLADCRGIKGRDPKPRDGRTWCE
jgi:arylsulfatase A-like enzyme